MSSPTQSSRLARLRKAARRSSAPPPSPKSRSKTTRGCASDGSGVVGNDPDKIARMAKINAFHVSLFAYYLERLRATPEGDGSLLDHSLLLYGSGIGNPNLHDHTNLPIIVAGGAAGGMRGGRHLRYEQPTPLANVHLALLDKVGVRLDRFGDSSGRADELFSPVTL